MPLATKFEICTKYDRTSRYTLSLDSTTGKYVMRNVTKLEDAYDVPATYSVRFVQEALDEGSWIMTKKLEEAVEREIASEDRPLVFPFTVLHSATPDEKEMFEVTKGYEAGRVTCTYFNDDGATYENCFTEEDAKKYIKEGFWLVKAVGEKPEEINVKEALKPFGITVGDAGEFTFTGALVKGFEDAPQPPESTVISTLKVVVECDTTEALANAKALAAAYEELAISMESVIALAKEMKNGF